MRNEARKLAMMCAAALICSGCTATDRAESTQALENTVVQTAQTVAETTVESTAVQTEEETETEALEAEVVTFTDDLGREVTVSDPGRVATLIGSFTDIWLLAGGEVVAAANDSWTSLELDLGEDVVNLGSILNPDLEQLIAAEPDFVIASANTDADIELEETLTQAGITVAYFAVSNFDDYLHMLDIATSITGRKDLYQENGLAVQEQIKQVKERIDGSAPTVLFLRTASGSIKAKGSKDNVGGEMLADLGCINIADQEESLLDDLSIEAIIGADPDYIFITTQGENTQAAMDTAEEQLLGNPAWSSLTAVQEGRYYVLDKHLYNLKPNAKWGQAYEQLADILYPEE